MTRPVPHHAWEGFDDGPVLDMCCASVTWDGDNHLCSLPLHHDSPHTCVDPNLPVPLVWPR